MIKLPLLPSDFPLVYAIKTWLGFCLIVAYNSDIKYIILKIRWPLA